MPPQIRSTTPPCLIPSDLNHLSANGNEADTEEEALLDHYHDHDDDYNSERGFFDDEPAGANMFGEVARVGGHGHIAVFMGIHRVRRLVIAAIEDPYTAEQLRGPQINKLIIRPLVERLYDPRDITLVYCLLANRVQFLRSQSTGHIQSSVTLARAHLCEILAAKVLRKFHEDHTGLSGLLLLANVLVAGFDPFQGAPRTIRDGARLAQWPVQDRGGHERKLTALELAVLAESKYFLSSRACVYVVRAIYEGRVTFTALSFMDILPDHYKHHPVAIYDPSKAPVLNHYRLKVPRSRNIIELIQFLVLTGLYFLAMAHRNSPWMEVFEPMFCLYTMGWIVEFTAAVIEHGWEVHSQSLWSFLDVAFSAIFCCYGVTRLMDLFMELPSAYSYGLDIICLAAPILLTRLAFTIMPDSIVFISMHAMLKDFFRMNFLVAWCFAGFSMSLIWLLKESNNSEEATDNPSYLTTVKWLIWIWFGLDATGIEKSTEYHFVFGPLLTISFAFLGNILFLTILVAILTNTFSQIIADAEAEIQFRRTVLAFQGVKSDSVFMYPPPFNVLALLGLLPLKFFVGPRLFHSINVFFIRVINAPMLVLIHLYERQHFDPAARRSGSWLSFFGFELKRFSPHADIDAVFEVDLPEGVLGELEKMDPLEEMELLEGGIGVPVPVPEEVAERVRKREVRRLRERVNTWHVSGVER